MNFNRSTEQITADKARNKLNKTSIRNPEARTRMKKKLELKNAANSRSKPDQTQETKYAAKQELSIDSRQTPRTKPGTR